MALVFICVSFQPAAPVEEAIDPFSIAYKASRVRKASLQAPAPKKNIPSRFGQKGTNRTQSANPESKRNAFNMSTIKEVDTPTSTIHISAANKVNSTLPRPSSANLEVKSHSEFLYPTENEWFEDDNMVHANPTRNAAPRASAIPPPRQYNQEIYETPRPYYESQIASPPLRPASYASFQSPSRNYSSIEVKSPEPHTLPLDEVQSKHTIPLSDFQRQSYQDVSASQYYESNFDDYQPYFPDPQTYPYEPVVVPTVNNHVNPNQFAPKSKPRVVANPFAQMR